MTAFAYIAAAHATFALSLLTYGIACDLRRHFRTFARTHDAHGNLRSQDAEEQGADWQGMGRAAFHTQSSIHKDAQDHV